VTPRTTTNKPAKNSSNDQSMLANVSSGGRFAQTSKTVPEVNATISMGAPARNPTRRHTVMMIVLTANFLLNGMVGSTTSDCRTPAGVLSCFAYTVLTINPFTSRQMIPIGTMRSAKPAHDQ